MQKSSSTCFLVLLQPVIFNFYSASLLMTSRYCLLIHSSGSLFFKNKFTCSQLLKKMRSKFIPTGQNNFFMAELHKNLGNERGVKKLMEAK